MLEAAHKADVQRFVYTSTESILKSYRAPRQSARALIDETVVLTLDDMPGPYCRSKFQAEQAAREAAVGGLPVVIVNPTMPIGPGDDLLTPPSKMILGFLNGETPAYLDCEFNLVDARDVAAGQVLAADKGRVGERYILGNVNLSLGELLAELQRLTGFARPRTRIPYALAAFVSARTPPDIIARLNKDHLKVLHDPTVEEQFKTSGNPPGDLTPEALKARIDRDVAVIGDVIQKNKVSLR